MCSVPEDPDSAAASSIYKLAIYIASVYTCHNNTAS